MKRIIHILSILLLFLSCSGCSLFDEDILSENEIKLSGMINNPSLSVKSGGPVYSDGTGDLNIGLVRSDVSGSAVPSFTGDALEAVMKRDGNSLTADPIEFTSYQYFQSNAKVHYASWSPLGTYDNANGKVTFDNIDGSTDILYGTPVSGTKETGFSPITFNHALVKFKVWVYAMVPVNEQTGAELYDPDERWGEVSQISVNDVPSTYTIVLPTDGTTYTFVPGDARSAESPFTVTAVSPEKFPRSFDTRKAVAEFMIPVSNTLTLNVKTSKLQTAQTISISKNFKQGYHYDIILRFTDHGLINSEVIAGNWADPEDKVLESLKGSVFFDLSQNETANCYMVSSANYNYCFDARIKGNGVNGVVDGTDVNLNPSYVKVLWQDASVTPASDGDPGFKLLSNKIASGMVLFTVKGNVTASDHSLTCEGNVLLGVYDEDPEANPQAKPLWTWHIWICDRPQVQGYKNGFTVQDRDLGAVASNPFDTGVNATDLDGLYYQWGRPTPLPLGRIDNVVSLGPGQSSPYVSLNERISTPLVYFPQKLDENQENLKSLWGWRSASEEYIKTIYDPCPPGYRVPSRRLWNEMKIEHAHIKGTQGNVTNSHSIHIELDDHYDIFYPVSGYYNGSMQWVGYYNGTQQTGGAYMWAATYDDAQKNPYSLLFDLDDAETNDKGELETESYSVTSNNNSFYALPVRCVSRRSSPHVEDLSAFQTANSYIVPSEGYYKFKANVRGNGVGRLVSPGSSEFIDVTEGLSTNMSDIVKVDYLWWQEAGGAAANPVTVPVILDNQGKVDDDGYVMFHIDSYKEGNLIIAGYDVDGNILWTWHLWLTDEPKQMKSHNFAVMDRFLGATFAPADGVYTVSDNEFNESIGFFYQWGRKDPFAVNSWYGYSGGSWSVGTYVTTNVSAEKTVPNSVSNPMRFHLGSGTLPENSSFPTTDYSNFDDYNIINNQCISTYRSDTGVETVRPALWGYSSASGLGKTTTKTMYDPCPPGYCVAFYTVWTSDDGYSYYTWLDGGYYDYDSRGNSVEIVDDKGIFVKANTFDETWYPFTGYRSGKDMNWYGSGSQGRFNSSTPVGKGSRSMYYDANGAGQAANGSSSGVPSSYALPVRCQKQ